MITKQQALEFIYELSKTYMVVIDLPVRTFKVTHKDGTFHGCSYGQDLETMIRNFIDVYIRIKKALKVNFPIPVDMSMLEVGQTYKVIFNEAQITDELTTMDDNNVYFRKHYPIKLQCIKKIYKVK